MKRPLLIAAVVALVVALALVDFRLRPRGES